MKKKIRLHLITLWHSVIVVGSLTTIATIVWLGWQIGNGLMVKSDAFYKAQAMLESYNRNHIKYETKHIYQKGINEGVK